ncbi:hypothetical protein [Methylacidimicrobium tartarophylax]|uniref:Uncharacterized protein n=1 Tax=Methylacidimicrobium tartarophylax TaxID=1041768 RepID=A0A5E6MH14_9BACT|nr:hypothetical protein [Methylacidimicrobium tartarophylax]VVM08302.1 hypothetical protein MAMT_02269 [Methylacidimicrobium tartarophylax]
MDDKKTVAGAPSAAVAAAPKPAAGGATSASSGPAHCPYRRTTDLLQRLAPNKMRIGFFIGAGCALSIRDADGKPLIPDIDGLTKQIKDSLDKHSALKTFAQTAWDRVIARGIPTPTVEDVLSHIRTLKSLCGKDAKSEVDSFSADILGKLDLTICEQVRTIVNKPLPTSDSPYHILASWIQAIPRERAVEIFTTN